MKFKPEIIMVKLNRKRSRSKNNKISINREKRNNNNSQPITGGREKNKGIPLNNSVHHK